jgi:sporulation protein YabP
MWSEENVISENGGVCMEERMGTEIKQHQVQLQNRKSIVVTGVRDVLSFDAMEILLDTSQGMLLIRGDELHVNRLSLDKGEVDVDGHISSLSYADEGEQQKNEAGFLRRLFQ